MFNDEFLLTQAVLEGRKTQIRWIVSQKTLDKIELFQEEYYEATFDKLEGVELLTHYFITEKLGKLPYNVGEVVAVAQSYRSIADKLENLDNATCAEHYEKNLQKSSEYISWMEHPGFNNKLFVAANKMLHQIRITNVSIQRLQEISDDDCLKEGVVKWDAGQKDIPFFCYPNSAKCDYDTPQEAFAHLINKVNRKDVWKENPYVFVYDFELVK